MSGPVTPRRAKLTLFAITFPLSVLVGWFAGEDFARLLRGFGERRAIIVSDPLAASGMILGIMAFSLAALCLVPDPKLETGKRVAKGPPARGTFVKYYLLFVAACIVAAGFAPSIQHALADDAALRRGYVRCPEIHWPRHQPDRWALPAPTGPTARCPREGASPNS